ncbi:PAS domain-containing protein [Halomonas sp.]|uniref:PAS domain-containing protein n=1 Tax=Halomonas sp. TaxID=1486246 RepID=UPI0025C4CED2|nr:PAS domain-containing protein [Halomonas sp.]
MTSQVQSPLFHALANLNFDSVMVTEPTDQSGASRIVFVNPKFTELTGYNADEVLGETPGMLQGARTDSEVLKRLADDLRSGRTFHGQTINYRKDGTPFEIEWKVTPVLDAAGNVTHYLAVQRQADAA